MEEFCFSPLTLQLLFQKKKKRIPAAFDVAASVSIDRNSSRPTPLYSRGYGPTLLNRERGGRAGQPTLTQPWLLLPGEYSLLLKLRNWLSMIKKVKEDYKMRYLILPIEDGRKVSHIARLSNLSCRSDPLPLPTMGEFVSGLKLNLRGNESSFSQTFFRKEKLF